MKTLVLVGVAIVLSACDSSRSFDEMSDDERLRVGSGLLRQACIASGDPHERSFLAQNEIERGHDYLAYVTARLRAGELDRHIDATALSTCLEVEGWRGELWKLILAKGTDQQVEVLVQSTTSPRLYRGSGHRRYESDEADRIVAACERLGLR